MPPVRTVVLLLAAAAAASCDRGPPPDPPALAAAEAKLAEGRYGEALRDLHAIPLADLPGPAACLRVARAAAKAKDFPLVLEVLRPDPRSGGKPSPEVRLLLAEALLRSGDPGGAKDALAALEKDGVRTERWRFLYALLCLVRGERDLGVAELDDLARGGSRDAEVLVRWAETVLDRPEEARRRLTEALDRATDRGPVLAGLGACLLLKEGDVELACLHLEEAVRLNPWDRDARLNLVRAWLRRSGASAVGRAGEEAARLVEQDPGDAVARMLLAECYGEKGRLALEPGAPAPSAASLRAWEQAKKEYGILLGGRIDDPVMAIRALQGRARIHVEEIPLDPTGKAMGPGTRYARAMEDLARAEALDPEGRLEGGPYGSKLIAETWYLRGRGARKAHTGDSDHTEALGCFQKAFRADPRHLDASWDLGLLCYDFFPKTKEYQELAAMAFRAHITMRKQAGLPPLDPERLAIARECMKRSGMPLSPDGKPGPPPPK